MRMRLIALEPEVFVSEAEDVLHIGIDVHARQRIRRARQLQLSLLDMIEIKMRIAERMDELARL